MNSYTEIYILGYIYIELYEIFTFRSTVYTLIHAIYVYAERNTLCLYTEIYSTYWEVHLNWDQYTGVFIRGSERVGGILPRQKSIVPSTVYVLPIQDYW